MKPALLGNVNTIERLLGQGADIHKHGEEDSARWLVDWFKPPNPLHLAVRYGVLSSAEVLIENGAELTPGKNSKKKKEDTRTMNLRMRMKVRKKKILKLSSRSKKNEMTKMKVQMKVTRLIMMITLMSCLMTLCN